MIVTLEIIKEYIEKCKVKDFTMNSYGIIDNDELSDDIDEIITNITNSIDENMESEIINNKIKFEIETA